MRAFLPLIETFLIVNGLIPYRLFLQHRMLKTAFDGEVILAPVDKSDALFVLDSGTGAGQYDSTFLWPFTHQREYFSWLTSILS